MSAHNSLNQLDMLITNVMVSVKRDWWNTTACYDINQFNWELTTLTLTSVVSSWASWLNDPANYNHHHNNHNIVHPYHFSGTRHQTLQPWPLIWIWPQWEEAIYRYSKIIWMVLSKINVPVFFSFTNCVFQLCMMDFFFKRNWTLSGKKKSSLNKSEETGNYSVLLVSITLVHCTYYRKTRYLYVIVYKCSVPHA